MAFFQPEIDAVSGHIVGAELLARWSPPGLVPIRYLIGTDEVPCQGVRHRILRPAPGAGRRSRGEA